MTKRGTKRMVAVAGVGGIVAAAMVLPVLADTGKPAAGPIAARQMLMETAKFAAGQAGAMVQEKAPYDAAKAELAMRTLNAVAIGAGHLFPDDSKTGGDTEAKPEIWTDRATFDKLLHELAEHSEKAVGAAKVGLPEFKAAFVATTKYCKECHETFRLEDKKK